MACQSQLRLAPSGHVVGLDLSAALEMVRARGFDLEILVELLPFAEAGMIESINENSET